MSDPFGFDLPGLRADEEDVALKAPEGMCDGHVEIFGSRDKYPLDPRSDETPPEMPLDAYREAREAEEGLRTVLVQPVAYGFDNRCLLDGLSVLGDRARAFVCVPTDVEIAELKDLTEAGVFGARFSMLPGQALVPWDEVGRHAARLHDLVGWVGSLRMPGRDLHEVERRIMEWPGRVIVEHGGLFESGTSAREPGFKALLRLIDRDKAWVKISAPYEMSKAGPPDYQDVADRARNLIDWAPERLIWGSDWPHVGQLDDPPTFSDLLQVLLDWCQGDEAVWRRILVDNPGELFRF